MLLRFNQRQDFSEDFEVLSFGRLKRLFLEEADDLPQVIELANSKFQPCVVVDHDLACSEELLQPFEDCFVALVLDDSEFWQNLPTD